MPAILAYVFVTHLLIHCRYWDDRDPFRWGGRQWCFKDTS